MKRFVSIVLGILLFLALSGCGGNTVHVQGDPGNLPGNLSNGGAFVSDGTHMFISITSGDYMTPKEKDGIYRVNMDGTDARQIFSGAASLLNYHDGKIYFVSNTYEGTPGKHRLVDAYVYAIPTDGDGIAEPDYLAPASYSRIRSMTTIGDWLFYSDEDGLFRLNIEEPMRMQKILADVVDFCIDGEWIYYKEVPETYAFNCNIKRIPLNGEAEPQFLCKVGLYNSVWTVTDEALYECTGILDRAASYLYGGSVESILAGEKMVQLCQLDKQTVSFNRLDSGCVPVGGFLYCTALTPQAQKMTSYKHGI